MFGEAFELATRRHGRRGYAVITSPVHRYEKGASMEKEAMKVEPGQRWLLDEGTPSVRERVVAYVDDRHGPGTVWYTAGSWHSTEQILRGRFVGWVEGYGPQPPAYPGPWEPCRFTGPCSFSVAHEHRQIGPNMFDARITLPASTIIVNAPVPQVAAAQEYVTPSGYARVGNLTALEAIRSRKPPEPWRPSIDDWDLLPDA